MDDTPEAGPSKPKRARFSSQAATDAAAMKVDHVDVEKYALSRGIEISAMEKAMKASRDSGAQRAFQSLPRHLRRRAASHNIRRLPKRLRAKAKIEMLQDQAKTLKKRKFRQIPIAKRRQLVRASRVETLHGRQRDKAWLETHIWHAKRMKMKDTWGYRLAYTPTDKAYRPSYRAAMHGVIVHDASYLQTLELKGSFAPLKDLLCMICDPAAVPPYSKRYISGVRECPIDLYEFEAYPRSLIGPASVIWAASSTPLEATEDAAVSRQLFLRFHPSILGAVAANVEKCLNALPGRALTSAGSSSNRVEAAARHTVVATYRNLCSFELTGPMATDTIKACLRPVKNTSQEKLNAWKNLTPPAAVPAGSVFALNVQDPRLHFPPTLAKSERSHGKSTFFRPSEGLAENKHFWDASYRKALTAPRYTKKELDDRRAKLMVPGTRLHPEAQDDSIPVMLVQRTIGPQMADRSVRGSSEKGTVFGWTLIVPSGWGSAFWHSLALADTRIGGLRERAQQYFEAGCHSFPDDYACTHAFKIEIDKKAKEAAGRWHRTPKAKRVNFDKLKTESPWRPHLTGITDVLEQELKDIIMLADDSAHQNENVRYLQKHEAKHAKSAPYLVGGMLVHQFLLKASSIIQAKDPLPQRTYRFAVSTYLQTLENIRAKRGLKPTGFRLLDAFVKVRVEPADRGSPKPNAIIYRLDACKPIPEAVEDSRNRKSKSCVGTKRKIDESVDKENVTEYTFATPASNDIMGYVTSGNMSLKEGKGQGIGVVSLLMLIQLMETEGVTMPEQSGRRVAVLFKNPASQVCRLAFLDILE